MLRFLKQFNKINKRHVSVAVLELGFFSAGTTFGFLATKYELEHRKVVLENKK